MRAACACSIFLGKRGGKRERRARAAARFSTGTGGVFIHPRATQNGGDRAVALLTRTDGHFARGSLRTRRAERSNHPLYAARAARAEDCLTSAAILANHRDRATGARDSSTSPNHLPRSSRRRRSSAGAGAACNAHRHPTRRARGASCFPLERRAAGARALRASHSHTVCHARRRRPRPHIVAVRASQSHFASASTGEALQHDLHSCQPGGPLALGDQPGAAPARAFGS